jgi:hypothetical protein
MEEGVAQTSLIDHEEGVCEADSAEIVGIRVDPVRFVKEREEVAVPLCRERRKFPDGGVWRVEVPNAGEKVVEDGDEWSTAVLEKARSDTGLTGGFIFVGVV